VVALGEYAAGMFTNSSELSTALRAAGERMGERLWPLPIFPEHRAEIRAAASADLQSTGGGRMGGACVAAAFLEAFIKAPSAPATTGYAPAWVHLDIAGPAMVRAGGRWGGVQRPRSFINGCHLTR
jgi:leucyl aminopeptidase